MASPSGYYNIAKVNLTVGGFKIGGYGADGGVEFEASSALAEVNTGADGFDTISIINNTGVKATITVMNTSPSAKHLGDLLEAQLNADGEIPRLNFLMEDLVTGCQVSAAYAVFMTRTMPSKGRVDSELVFELHLAGAAKTTKIAKKIKS